VDLLNAITAYLYCATRHGESILPRLAIALLLVLTLGCGSDGPSAPEEIDTAWYFPPLAGTAWTTASPAAARLDSAALHAALDWVGTQETKGVVVLWRGRMVAERYWQGWDLTSVGPVFSAGKTITGALVGDLAAEGLVALDAPVSTYLGAGWSRAGAAEPAITVRHLLSMSSGLDDSLRFVDAPGSRFYYNNPAYYQLFGILEAASGQGFADLVRDRLLTRIGMNRTIAVANTDTGEPGFIFGCSTRDFARFGSLMLQSGRWDGETILRSSAYHLAARTWTGTDNKAYGYLWWLNGSSSYRTPGPYLLPTYSGSLFPEAPMDLVAALGLDDKKLYLVPSRDLVIVRLGDRAPASGGVSPEAISTFDNEFWQRLSLALLP
jgi:CubicO group peptidase (beta-lactamase class C family)